MFSTTSPFDVKQRLNPFDYSLLSVADSGGWVKLQPNISLPDHEQREITFHDTIAAEFNCTCIVIYETKCHSPVPPSQVTFRSQQNLSLFVCTHTLGVKQCHAVAYLLRYVICAGGDGRIGHREHSVKFREHPNHAVPRRYRVQCVPIAGLVG